MPFASVLLSHVMGAAAIFFRPQAMETFLQGPFVRPS